MTGGDVVEGSGQFPPGPPHSHISLRYHYFKRKQLAQDINLALGIGLVSFHV